MTDSNIAEITPAEQPAQSVDFRRLAVQRAASDLFDVVMCDEIDQEAVAALLLMIATYAAPTPIFRAINRAVRQAT